MKHAVTMRTLLLSLAITFIIATAAGAGASRLIAPNSRGREGLSGRQVPREHEVLAAIEGLPLDLGVLLDPKEHGAPEGRLARLGRPAARVTTTS